MKPTLFFAVIRSRSYSNRDPFEILEITTERGRQVYGRDRHGAATHVASRDVLARCKTKATADEVLGEAATIKDRWRDKISQLRHELSAAESGERNELDAMVTRYRIDGTPA
jgi:hypothetical protein